MRLGDESRSSRSHTHRTTPRRAETHLRLEPLERSMDDPLLTHEAELVTGTIVDRPNRFVLRVEFDGAVEQVHLGDPGVLPTLLAPGNEIRCSPVDDADRVTAYDAIAVRTGTDTSDVEVGVRATLANDLFAEVLDRNALPWLGEYASITREPPLPDHGRTDFLLESDDGDPTYVEVKSCSLARDGVARYPDRSTDRGRRHLRSLERLAAERIDSHVVFVVQRPDVRAFRPLREVDPAFADLLGRVRTAGVDVRAVVTPFEAPHYRLSDADLPVELPA